MSQATLDSERASRGFLIDMLLDQQQQLSAVERFSQQHEAHETPLGARLYQDLIPLSLPGPGEQFAFEVDLDACSGCKACVAACHSLNGLEEDELWRSVGMLVGGSEQLPVIHHVTTACHHCVEPACLQGCPVKAYEKDPVTGIVRHLDDQCIGCQYCVLKCPYDVPAYSPSKGIVRKCDMCHQRLSAGEAPACVQSCPNQAIRIRIVEQADSKQAGSDQHFLPTAPAPDYTIPTTVYKSTKGFSESLVAGDYYTMRRAHSHSPLVVLLVLTQLAVGGFLAIHALQMLNSAFAIGSASLLRPIALTAAFAVLQAGLGASILHLGRPLYAFRAFLGWRTSWMSREIIVFGAFAGLAGATASAAWSDRLFIPVPPLVQSSLSVATTLVGLWAIFCSAMIYIDTRRPTWSLGPTMAKFYLTSLASGSGLIASATLLTQYLVIPPNSPVALSTVVTALCWCVMIGNAAKLILELSALRPLGSEEHSPARRSALLLVGPLRGLLMARLALGIVGGLLLPLVMLLGLSESAMSTHLLLLCGTSLASTLLLVGGELVERYLFFATCVAAKMPGAPGNMSATPLSLPGKLEALVKAAGGYLTQDLVQEPARFGLGRVPTRLVPNATTQMVCGFCSTGCSLNVHLRDGEAINLTPAVEYPVNLGMACPKGWEALSVLKAPDRATTPLLRDAQGRMQPVTWADAVETFRRRFKGIQARHGKQSVAFLSTGQMPTEEMIYLGALAKFGMGMVHGDGNTRQCMATAAVAYKQAFGFDAPPFTYQDFEESDCIVLIGSNLCIAHPIMWQRILRNLHEPELIVIDPRRTETAMSATQHLALAPKSDLALLYGIAHLLIEADWIDRAYITAHTEDFEAFREHVRPYTPDRVAELTGIEADRLWKFAQTIHERKRVSFWWTMGVNQSYEGVRTAQAIINLALMTGNIGRPGTGANSITGQCNAMGSRLFSNTTNLFGGRSFTSADDRQDVAKILDIDVGKIPTQESWPYHEIIAGIERGDIKGLWVICTNPANSWIDHHQCHELLGKLDFLVVQDMYSTTETAQLADLVLPAAGWGEKDGTFINSERRIGVIKKVAKAPGQALADFSIFRLLADGWGCGDMFVRWQSPDDVFQSMKELSRGRPCDITGIRDHQMLDGCGGVQWPFTEADAAVSPEGNPEQQRRLLADGRFFHPNGRARFLFEAPRGMPEPPSESFPYLLLSGRGTAAQWHTQTRTGKSPVLRKLGPPNLYVEINPLDAQREGIRPEQFVIVESLRGSVRAKAFVTPTVKAGQVFMPMHYEATNKLTLSHFDPYSHQPSYKDCAVRLRQPTSIDSD